MVAHSATILILGFGALYPYEVVEGVCVAIEGVGLEVVKHIHEEGLLCQVVVLACL